MAALPLMPADFWSESFPVVDAFQERIRSTGVGTVWMTLIAFLVTFLITRTITHLIKAGKGPFGDISVGGTHLHHLVPGIFLLLISGVLGIAVDWQPPSPWSLIVPALFGIRLVAGVALPSAYAEAQPLLLLLCAALPAQLLSQVLSPLLMADETLIGVLTRAHVATAVFLAGGLFFRHLKRGFADVL